MADRKLYLRVGCGLCNRWRTLLCGIRLAEEQDRELVLIWPKAHECNVHFNELWEPVFQQIRLPEFLGLDYPRYSDDRLDQIQDASEPIIRVNTCGTFPCRTGDPEWGAYSNRLKVVPRWREQIDAFYADHLKGQKVVGVNIRYDGMTHPASRQTTPAWFLQQMQHILDREPAVKFFLSVDSVRLRRMLEVAVSAARCLLIPKTTYKHATPTVTFQSLVEIYLMAECHHVLGSYKSSMSTMPRHLSGVGCTNHTMELPDIDFSRPL